MVKGYSPELGSAALLETYLRFTALCMYELIFDSFDGNQTKKQVTDWLLELFSSGDFHALKVCCCCACAMWSLCMCLYLFTPAYACFSRLAFTCLSVYSFTLSDSEAVTMIAR